MANATYEKLKNANVLPSPTGVALALLRMASDERTTLDAIAAVVQTDPAVAGRVLKLVNSSFAALPRRIASLPVGVKLLGLRTVKNLALGLSLVSNHSAGRCPAFDYDRFWSESFGRAVAAQQLAQRLKDVPADEAFSAGLLARIGCLALATAYPAQYAQVLEAGGGVGQLAAREREAFGIDHNELVGELLGDWRVEPIICEAARYQSVVDRADAGIGPRSRQLARLLHLADGVASVLVAAGASLETLKALKEEAGALGLVEAFPALFDAIGKQWRETGEIFSVSTRDIPSLEELRAQAQAKCDPAGGVRPETPAPRGHANAESLRILVVDDDPAMLRLLTRHLTGAGHEVITATNGAEALEIDRVEAVQMILTDWVMPEMDGLELCRRLRANESRGFVYMIVLTARSETARAIEALDAGADDFLSKPFSREELLAHVHAGGRIVRLESDVARRSCEISLYNARLAAANEKLTTLATTDELTGLVNRRQGLERLAEYWSARSRCDEPLSCVVIDVDHFKRANDTYGHAAGDAILKAVARVLRGTVRAGELACRVGGDEFLILCPKSTVAAAQLAAERMRLAVASHPVRIQGETWSVTLSMGVAQRQASMRSPRELLKAADDMLYAAKQAGRNRVCADGAQGEPRPIEADSRAGNEPRGGQMGGDLPGLPVNVLIVDDDAAARALSRRLLERDGYVVCEASDGREAIERIPACSPDVIVLDSRMPVMDGLECARRLKAEGATQDIPIIMLSAAAQAKDIEAGLEAGVDEYITKPFRPREFTLRVRSMARLRRSKAELIWSNQRCWEQTRTLQVLLDLSVGLAASENLNGILERAVAAAAELTRSRRVSIMMPDAAGTHLTIARSIGIEARTAMAVNVPMGTAIAGQVFASGREVVVNHPDQIEQRRSPHDAGYFVSAPLVSKALQATRRVVGVLNITDRHNQRPFEASELESLDLLCNATATAIDDLVSRQERNDAQDSIVVALATLAEYRDADTGKHLDRVTRYALMLAEGLRSRPSCTGRIDSVFLHSLRRAMPLHDIGKVAVPDHILLKPGKLTPEEMDQMKRHAEDGARTIRTIIERMPSVEFLQMAEDIAWSHHERWDGTGYPRGLAGQAIPLAARIAAVADVYDALTTKRVYKDAVSHEKAAAILRKDAGTHFDPTLIEVFLAGGEDFARVGLELADMHVAGRVAEPVVAG